MSERPLWRKAVVTFRVVRRRKALREIPDQFADSLLRIGHLRVSGRLSISVTAYVCCVVPVTVHVALSVQTNGTCNTYICSLTEHKEGRSALTVRFQS